jgi:hypothetical protein
MNLNKLYEKFQPSHFFYFLSVFGFILEVFEIKTYSPIPWYLYGFLGWGFRKSGH